MSIKTRRVWCDAYPSRPRDVFCLFDTRNRINRYIMKRKKTGINAFMRVSFVVL